VSTDCKDLWSEQRLTLGRTERLLFCPSHDTIVLCRLFGCQLTTRQRHYPTRAAVRCGEGSAAEKRCPTYNNDGTGCCGQAVVRCDTHQRSGSTPTKPRVRNPSYELLLSE
jgi:hypothetical protein